MNEYTEIPFCSWGTPNTFRGNTINRDQIMNLELQALIVCQRDDSTNSTQLHWGLSCGHTWVRYNDTHLLTLYCACMIQTRLIKSWSIVLASLSNVSIYAMLQQSCLSWVCKKRRGRFNVKKKNINSPCHETFPISFFQQSIEIFRFMWQSVCLNLTIFNGSKHFPIHGCWDQGGGGWKAFPTFSPLHTSIPTRTLFLSQQTRNIQCTDIK